MKKLLLLAGCAALAACGQREEAAPAENAADADMTMDANATADANMATPAGFQINETSWEFTREGKAQTESVDANGNYVAWSGNEHVDHGTAVVKGDKVCFTSAMNQEGEVCWTTPPTELAVGESFEATSDKGEKLTVRKIAYTAVPENVKP